MRVPRSVGRRQHQEEARAGGHGAEEEEMAQTIRHRRRRKHGDDGDSPDKSHSSEKELLRNSASKYKSLKTRLISSFWMIGGFILFLYMGHVYIWVLVMVIQLFMARELFNLACKSQQEVRLPWFRTLNWLFFVTGMVYVYGQFLNKQLMVAMSQGKTPARIFVYPMKYHAIICYVLYTIAFVWFILSLKKGLYKYQFVQYAWTHMILFTVFAQSSFTVANIFEGIIWFLLPASLIIINDCAAYFFGFFLGRTPLIKLSPKKTWEGFIGGSVATIISAVLLAGFMGQFEWLTCPRKDLSVGPLHCDPGAFYRFQEHTLPSWSPVKTLWLMPLQRHAVVFGIFASLVAPFGGFFASGFKRAFKIKDFGDSIPGHGGMTDRMDCQMVMAVFSYIYYQTFIAPHAVTVGGLLSKALTLPSQQQQELYEALGNVLYGEGVEVTLRTSCSMT